jgi:tetratricopeptide (TPR) repeat protein
MSFPMKRSLALLVLLLAALPLCGQDYMEIRSPHFIVITDAGLVQGRAAALHFEQTRQLFGELLQQGDIRSSGPFTLYVFKTTRGMRQQLPVFHGQPTNQPGLFVAADDGDYVALDWSDANAIPAVAHDYAHVILDANTPPMPLWYDEGIAELLATLTFRYQDVDFGARPAYVDQVLRGKLMPTEQFLRLGRRAPGTGEDDRHSAYHAQAWLMVSWLQSHHMLPQCNQYSGLILMKHAAPEQAFQQAFQMTPAEFDKTLAAYLAAGNQAQSLALPDNLNDVSTYAYQNEKLNPRAAQVALIDLRAHIGDYVEQSIRELNAVLQQDQYNAGAERTLGYIYLRKNDLANAKAHLDQATDLDKHDARAHYYAAALLSRSKDLGASSSAVFQMRGDLLTALDGEPSLADGWALLAFVYEAQEKWVDSINTMLKAIKMSPRNDEYRLALARIYSKAGDTAAASSLFDYLKDSPDPEVAAKVQAAQAQIEAAKHAPPKDSRFSTPPLPQSYDDPKWRPKPGQKDPTEQIADDADDAAIAAAKAPPKADARPVQFLKGKLVDVSCQPNGAATLTIVFGKRRVKLTTPDYKKAVLINADSFSCAWRDVAVAANYRASSPTSGDLVSLELQ